MCSIQRKRQVRRVTFTIADIVISALSSNSDLNCCINFRNNANLKKHKFVFSPIAMNQVKGETVLSM